MLCRKLAIFVGLPLLFFFGRLLEKGPYPSTIMEARFGGAAAMEIVPFLAVLLVSLVASARALTNQEDVYALNQLYIALNSPTLTGWTAYGGDPCSEGWEGVACADANVTLLQLPGHQLIGGLGASLENLTTLIVLDLSDNLLSGGLPFQLPPHVQQLFLSSNLFTGNLPFALSDLSNLATLNVSGNQLSGNLPDIFAESELLTTLDLSNNDLDGLLPPSFAKLASLDELYLENNRFTGTIDVLANLPIKKLDLSNNSFTGWIPPELKHFPSSQFAGNSFNTFPAPPPPPLVPPPPQISNSESTSERSPVSKSKQTTSMGGFMTLGRLVGIVVAAILAVAVAVLVILFFAYRTQQKAKDDRLDPENAWDGPLIPAWKEDKLPEDKHSKETEPLKKTTARDFSMLKPPPVENLSLGKSTSLKATVKSKGVKSSITAKSYTIAELQLATNSFDNEHLLGDGTIGKVYKAELPDGKIAAVKKLDYSISRVADEDFLEFLAKVSCLQHPNITELVGYCLEHGERLLVYEFIDNGSLYENLHTDRSEMLSWQLRVKVALGVAKALEYLHERCRPPVLHRNLTSVNILLDQNYKPYVSDCGLATLVSLGEQQQAYGLEFTGYSAPEHTKSGVYTALSDVYSFGVVMLELLTGRKALDSSRPRPEQFLAKWVVLDIDALANMVDPSLKGMYSTVSVSRYADVISQCLQADPEFRPPMSEVTQLLESLAQSLMQHPGS